MTPPNSDNERTTLSWRTSTMTRSPDDDELDPRLSTDLDSPSAQLSNAEQEQGLLGGRTKGYSKDANAVYSRHRRWSPAAWIAMAAAVTLSLVICACAVLALGGLGQTDATVQPEPEMPPEHDGVKEFEGVKTNDYILDPNWDFQAKPQRREYTWTVRDQEHNPDGVYRQMILVENQYPGPLIECNEGDTIVVHVHNEAVNATSIHWHGLYQRGTPHMDGAVGITQCPIAPGGSFTYEFTVSDQSGTYWWHAHQGIQSADGVHGPLIIHNRNNKNLQKIEYASDRVLLVSDHYHDLSSGLLWQYLAPDVENTEPVPQSALINGRGMRNCEDFPDRKCDSTTLPGPPTLDLAPGVSHRIRIINVGAFAEFQVQIDEHQLAVTEVDGTDVNPEYFHRININTAQRYSVIVTTNSTTSNNFWLRARMLKGCFTDPPKTLQTDINSIVRYSRDNSDHDQQPTSVDWEEKIPLECKDLNTTNLRPVEVIAAPPVADAFFYLRTNFEIGDYRLSRGFFNSSTWHPNVRSPTLLRTIDGVASDNSSFAASTSSTLAQHQAFVNDVAFEAAHELVIQTTGTQTIDILLSNFDDGNHPIHLHGYKFFILAEGHGYPPRITKLEGMYRENVEPLYESLDLTNPLRRDTASVEAYGWTLLRIVTDNPGAWAFHCHVSWHIEAGLMMQLVTSTDELAKLDVPAAHRDLCTAQGLEKGMAPKDEVYYEFAK